MNNHEKIAVDPQIKKEINKEGFEYGGRDNEEAAVLIGKKEEMPQMLERLEKEGMAEDLGSYIKMHKEIALPIDEMDAENREENIKNKGNFWLDNEKNIYFVDKDGNIARVIINPQKIHSLKGKYLPDLLVEELNKLGFNEIHSHGDEAIAYQIKICKYQEDIKKNIENKKKEEFDF